MWPILLDMTRDECRGKLRRLELEAYSTVISTLRAQGGLNDNKSKLLDDLRNVLHISQDRHRAESRRAANDEQLCTIAEIIYGPNTGQDWNREGRRPFPMLPRSTPYTALTAVANGAAEIATSENSLLPHPTETAKEEIKEESSLHDDFEQIIPVVVQDPLRMTPVSSHAVEKRHLKRANSLGEQITSANKKRDQQQYHQQQHSVQPFQSPNASTPVHTNARIQQLYNSHSKTVTKQRRPQTSNKKIVSAKGRPPSAVKQTNNKVNINENTNVTSTPGPSGINLNNKINMGVANNNNNNKAIINTRIIHSYASPIPANNNLNNKNETEYYTDDYIMATNQQTISATPLTPSKTVLTNNYAPQIATSKKDITTNLTKLNFSSVPQQPLTILHTTNDQFDKNNCTIVDSNIQFAQNTNNNNQKMIQHSNNIIIKAKMNQQHDNNSNNKHQILNCNNFINTFNNNNNNNTMTSGQQNNNSPTIPSSLSSTINNNLTIITKSAQQPIFLPLNNSINNNNLTPIGNNKIKLTTNQQQQQPHKTNNLNINLNNNKIITFTNKNQLQLQKGSSLSPIIDNNNYVLGQTMQQQSCDSVNKTTKPKIEILNQQIITKCTAVTSSFPGLTTATTTTTTATTGLILPTTGSSIIQPINMNLKLLQSKGNVKIIPSTSGNGKMIIKPNNINSNTNVDSKMTTSSAAVATGSVVGGIPLMQKLQLVPIQTNCKTVQTTNGKNVILMQKFINTAQNTSGSGTALTTSNSLSSSQQSQLTTTGALRSIGLMKDVKDISGRVVIQNNRLSTTNPNQIKLTLQNSNNKMQITSPITSPKSQTTIINQNNNNSNSSSISSSNCNPVTNNLIDLDNNSQRESVAPIMLPSPVTTAHQLNTNDESTASSFKSTKQIMRHLKSATTVQPVKPNTNQNNNSSSNNYILYNKKLTQAPSSLSSLSIVNKSGKINKNKLVNDKQHSSAIYNLLQGNSSNNNNNKVKQTIHVSGAVPLEQKDDISEENLNIMLEDDNDKQILNEKDWEMELDHVNQTRIVKTNTNIEYLNLNDENYQLKTDDQDLQTADNIKIIESFDDTTLIDDNEQNQLVDITAITSTAKTPITKKVELINDNTQTIEYINLNDEQNQQTIIIEDENNINNESDNLFTINTYVMNDNGEVIGTTNTNSNNKSNCNTIIADNNKNNYYFNTINEDNNNIVTTSATDEEITSTDNNQITELVTTTEPTIIPINDNNDDSIIEMSASYDVKLLENNNNENDGDTTNSENIMFQVQEIDENGESQLRTMSLDELIASGHIVTTTTAAGDDDDDVICDDETEMNEIVTTTQEKCE